MTQKELGAALELYHEIQRKVNSLNRIEATGGIKTAGKFTPVQGGDRVSDVQRAAELSEEIKELQEQLKIERAVIRRGLEKIPFTKREHEFMVLRYVECMPWADVADKLGYTERRIFQLHVGALQRISVDFT